MPEPLSREEYGEQRKVYADLYLASIREYDRLVTWGAGGALLLSITFLEKIAPSGGTTWLLGTAWLLLVVALGSSVASQYTSSRIYSARLRSLDEVHELEPSLTKWSAHEQVARRAGTWTKWLTRFSGAFLVVGIGVLTAFAFLSLTGGTPK